MLKTIDLGIFARLLMSEVRMNRRKLSFSIFGLFEEFQSADLIL
jgi:hypothetical protein